MASVANNPNPSQGLKQSQFQCVARPHRRVANNPNPSQGLKLCLAQLLCQLSLVANNPNPSQGLKHGDGGNGFGCASGREQPKSLSGIETGSIRIC